MPDRWKAVQAERERLMSGGWSLTVTITQNGWIRVHDPRLDYDRTNFVSTVMSLASESQRVSGSDNQWKGRDGAIDFETVALCEAVFPLGTAPF